MKKIVVWSLVLAMLLTLFPLSLAFADDMVTLRVEVYDRGNTTATYGSITDNYWTRWMQKNFGDPNNIKLEYVAVPRSNDSDKINTMMAAGTAPDIIFGYNTTTLMQYGKDGGLWDLKDLIEEYAPNIKEHLSDALPYGMYEGQQFCIVAKRSATGRYANFIRKDWLDKIGYELKLDEQGLYHMSVEDYTELVYRFKNEDLDGCGMEMYPVGATGAYDATFFRAVIYSFINRAELTDEIHATRSELLFPGYKDGLRFLNQLYNDGIIDPDFMVDTDTSYPAFTAQVSTGRVLTYPQDDFYKTGVEALLEVKPDAEVVPFVLDNVHGEPYAEVYAPTGMYVCVPKTCQHPEAAVKYLNFLADYDTAMVTYYGIEGQNYEMVDGIPAPYTFTDADYAKQEGLEMISVADLQLLYNGNPFGYSDSRLNRTPAEVKVLDMTDAARIVSRYGGVAPYYYQGIRTAAEEEYDGFVTDLTRSIIPLITCKPDAFDAMYDTAVQDYMNAGGKEVIDSKVELYRQLEAAK